jgi:ATP-dependent Clp protease adaptor protein ClpS
MNQPSPLVPKESPRPTTASREEPLYRIFVHNDHVTPMHFVLHILSTVFLVPSPNAEHTMYTAHFTGRAYVQTLPAFEARRRIHKAEFAARLSQLPLTFSMEAE